jgi:hypothetical protein
MRKPLFATSVFQGYDVHQQVIHLVIRLDPLTFLPLPDCPFLRFLKTETVGLLNNNVEFLTGVLIWASLYDASEGIGAAGARSIQVYRTTRFAHKWTTQFFMLFHLEADDRQTRPWAYVMRGIAFQELSGGELQPLLETQDIIGRQELI